MRRGCTRRWGCRRAAGFTASHTHTHARTHTHTHKHTHVHTRAQNNTHVISLLPLFFNPPPSPSHFFLVLFPIWRSIADRLAPFYSPLDGMWELFNRVTTGGAVGPPPLFLSRLFGLTLMLLLALCLETEVDGAALRPQTQRHGKKRCSILAVFRLSPRLAAVDD